MAAETHQHDIVRRSLEQRQRVATRETPNADEVEAPLHWPSLAALNAQREWPKFSEWVGELRDRYKGLDSYVVPACWYEHESLVMALQALRDHERVAYAKSSPASSGTDWHRAYRDITALLRAFTADLRCGHGPESAETGAFDKFVAADVARRRRQATAAALGQSAQ
jgi:hypothetical protein